MAQTVANGHAGRQATSLDRDTSNRSTDVDLDQFFVWIRQGMAELDYTLEALGAAMVPPRDKSYVDKVLRQEKPCSLAFLRALPDDLEAYVSRKHTESFGHLVVEPAPDVDTAARHLISGIFGLVAARRLDVQAPMLKADLKPWMAKAGLR